MQLVYGNRASRVLFNFLSIKTFEKPFLVPVNICEIVPIVFREAGVEFRYSDIDPDTLCIDQRWVLQHISEYSGVLFVHSYGTERSFEEFYHTVKVVKPDFKIIDDRCLCRPTLTEPNTYSDLVLFSVGEKKQVDLGYGGYAFIRDDLHYRVCPLPPGSILTDSTWDFDANLISRRTLEAATHRDYINEIYRTQLPIDIQLDEEFQNWRFNILVQKKNEILDELFENELFASSHYMPQRTGYSCASALNSHIINLFNDCHYTAEMAKKTCSIINNLL